MSTTTTAHPVTYGQDASIARFTVEQYERMIDAGVFDDDDRLELLEGYLVLKMTHNPEHDGTIDLVGGAIADAAPNGWFARVQSSIRLNTSQPEPDIAIVRGPRNRYLKRHPQADDIGLLVEVACSSLRLDLKDKARIYARAGVERYWVVDVEHQRVEVFTGPSGPTDEPSYSSRSTLLPGDNVALILDGVEVANVAVAELLPPA